MTEMEKLLEKHRKEIKKLQDLCEHKKSEILPYYWAMGHFGHYGEFCSNCNKELRVIPTEKVKRTLSKRTNSYVYKEIVKCGKI